LRRLSVHRRFQRSNAAEQRKQGEQVTSQHDALQDSALSAIRPPPQRSFALIWAIAAQGSGP
jgi:hypothetical protein